MSLLCRFWTQIMSAEKILYRHTAFVLVQCCEFGNSEFRQNTSKKSPINALWYDHTGQILRGTAPEWVRNLTFHVIFFGGMLTNIYSKVNHIWIWRLANKAGKMGQDSNMSSCVRIPSLADSVPIPDTLRRFLPSVIVPLCRIFRPSPSVSSQLKMLLKMFFFHNLHDIFLNWYNTLEQR